MDVLRHKKHMQWKQNRKDIYYFIVKYTNRTGNPPPNKINLKRAGYQLDCCPETSETVWGRWTGRVSWNWFSQDIRISRRT